MCSDTWNPRNRAWRRRPAGERPLCAAVTREDYGGLVAESPITVLIADDQQLVRRGFRVILEAEPDIRMVAEAGDGREAIELVRRHLMKLGLRDRVQAVVLAYELGFVTPEARG